MISRPEAQALAEKAARGNYSPEELIGSSPSFQSALGELDLFATALNIYDLNLETGLNLQESLRELHPPLLIRGERGTGKPLYAYRLRNLIDDECRRSNFYRYECSILTYESLRSDFFNRASKPNPKLARERKVAIFLDEIGKIELKEQTRLNAVITEGIWSDEAHKRFNVAFIATTNQDLESKVAAGDFDSDLLMRFSSFPVKVPSLREMREDIPSLIQTLFYKHGLGLYGLELDVKRNVSVDALVALLNYDWPGNGSELQSEIVRLLIKLLKSSGTERVIELTMLKDNIRAGLALDRVELANSTAKSSLILAGPFKLDLDREKIVAANGITVDLPRRFASVLSAFFEKDPLFRSALKSSLGYEEIAIRFTKARIEEEGRMVLNDEIEDKIQSHKKEAEEFARQLRKFLKKRGINNRKAIIICDTKSGSYRIGDGWDSNPVIGASEPGMTQLYDEAQAERLSADKLPAKSLRRRSHS